MEELRSETTSMKQSLQLLLDSNSDRIQLSPIRRGHRMTSESVKFYQRISLDNKLTDFVSCVLCKRIVTYVVENGVKTLNWHLINCINSDNFDESLYNSLISDKNTDSIDSNTSSENKTINSQVLCGNGLDESICDENKLLIEDLSQENFKIKQIVKICLKLINSCDCFDSQINNDKKRVNSMISDYNKYINSKRIEKFGNSGNKSNGLVNDNEEHKELVKSEPQVNGNEGLVEPVNSEVCDNEEHEESVISEPEVIDIEENEELADSEPEMIDNEEYEEYEESINNSEVNSENNKDLRTDLKILASDYFSKQTKTSKESKLRAIAINKKYFLLKQKYLASNFNHKYVCDWIGCGKVYRIAVALRNHRKIHTEVHNYVCCWPGCEQEFPNQSLLNCHIRKHKNLQRFKCNQCGYGTDHKWRFIIHQKVHTEVKQFSCDWPGCGFKTHYINNFKRHERIHTDERPFKCQYPECEWSFRSSDNLKVHMLKHTGERPVECAEAGCGQRFTTRQVMRFHYERKHKHS